MDKMLVDGIGDIVVTNDGVTILKEMDIEHPAAKMLVEVAKTQEDLFESIRTMTVLKKEVKTPITYLANGKEGSLSRIINPLLGAHIAFCMEHYDGQTFVGQPELRSMRTIVDTVERNI